MTVLIPYQELGKIMQKEIPTAGNHMASGPTWRWEWNINTVMQLITIAAVIFGGGYTISKLEESAESNRRGIENLSGRVIAIEMQAQRLEIHELRIKNMETTSDNTTKAVRDLEGSLNSLVVDMRVAREILQRLESSSSPSKQR